MIDFAAVIVGCGMSGRRHLSAVLRAGSLSVQGLYDADPSRAAALAEEYSVPVIEDLSAIRPAVPGRCVAFVCTPPDSHLDLAEQLLSAGFHVLVEKPLDVDTTKVSRVLKCAERHNLRIGAVAQHRFAPDVRFSKRILDQGELGELVGAHIRIRRRRSEDYFLQSSANWRTDRQRCGGGVLMTVGFHYVDLAQWLIGAPSAARVLTARSGIAGEDQVIACFLLGQVPCTIDARWGDCDTEPDTLVISGRKSCAVLAGDRLVGRTGQDEAADLHVLQLEDFLESITRKRDPSVTPLSVLPGLELIACLYEDARVGGFLP